MPWQPCLCTKSLAMTARGALTVPAIMLMLRVISEHIGHSCSSCVAASAGAGQARPHPLPSLLRLAHPPGRVRDCLALQPCGSRCRHRSAEAHERNCEGGADGVVRQQAAGPPPADADCACKCSCCRSRCSARKITERSTCTSSCCGGNEGRPPRPVAAGRHRRRQARATRRADAAAGVLRLDWSGASTDRCGSTGSSCSCCSQCSVSLWASRSRPQAAPPPSAVQAHC